MDIYKYNMFYSQVLDNERTKKPLCPKASRSRDPSGRSRDLKKKLTGPPMYGSPTSSPSTSSSTSSSGYASFLILLLPIACKFLSCTDDKLRNWQTFGKIVTRCKLMALVHNSTLGSACRYIISLFKAEIFRSFRRSRPGSFRAVFKFLTSKSSSTQSNLDNVTVNPIHEGYVLKWTETSQS